MRSSLKEWIIYRHTNSVTGRSYIGLTSQEGNARWLKHLSDARNGSETHFHRAIRLYGEEAWQMEILQDCVLTRDEANAFETHYIKKFDTFDNGYNSTIGGWNPGNKGTTWTAEKIAEANDRRKRYEFIHYTHGREYLTPHELADKYEILPGGIRSLVSGCQDSHKGWQLYSVVGDLPTNFNDSLEEYHFIHPDFGEEVTTCRELSNKYPVKFSEVNQLVQDKRKVSRGWRLYETKDWVQSYNFKLKGD